jgi:hypothetical protein
LLVAVSIGYDQATIGLGWLVVWAALRSSVGVSGVLLLHNAAIAQQRWQLGDVGGDAPGLCHLSLRLSPASDQLRHEQKFLLQVRAQLAQDVGLLFQLLRLIRETG